MILPTNHFPSALPEPPVDHLAAALNNVQQYNCADFSTLRFFAFLPIVVTEKTEYKCQSVFRSAVPLGC